MCFDIEKEFVCFVKIAEISWVMDSMQNSESTHGFSQSQLTFIKLKKAYNFLKI